MCFLLSRLTNKRGIIYKKFGKRFRNIRKLSNELAQVCADAKRASDCFQGCRRWVIWNRTEFVRIELYSIGTDEMPKTLCFLVPNVHLLELSCKPLYGRQDCTSPIRKRWSLNIGENITTSSREQRQFNHLSPQSTASIIRSNVVVALRDSNGITLKWEPVRRDKYSLGLINAKNRDLPHCRFEVPNTWSGKSFAVCLIYHRCEVAAVRLRSWVCSNASSLRRTAMHYFSFELIPPDMILACMTSQYTLVAACHWHGRKWCGDPLAGSDKDVI